MLIFFYDNGINNIIEINKIENYKIFWLERYEKKKIDFY